MLTASGGRISVHPRLPLRFIQLQALRALAVVVVQWQPALALVGRWCLVALAAFWSASLRALVPQPV